MPDPSQFVFQEVAESVHDVWVGVDQLSGLEPGAKLELIEEAEPGTGPRILRVDRDDSP